MATWYLDFLLCYFEAFIFVIHFFDLVSKIYLCSFRLWYSLLGEVVGRKSGGDG